MHPQSRPQPRPADRSGPRHTGYDEEDDEVADDDDEDDDGYADGEGEPCPNCGRVYRYMHIWFSTIACVAKGPARSLLSLHLVMLTKVLFSRTGDFWIACDFCDTWYDGKCVQVCEQCTLDDLTNVCIGLWVWQLAAHRLY